MPTVKQILADKAMKGVYTVDAGYTVHAAVALLAYHGIGALVVVDNGEPVGIFSERDTPERASSPASAPTKRRSVN